MKYHSEMYSTFNLRKMLILLLVIYFCHSAIGAVIPEYTNASVDNAGKIIFY